MYEEQQNNNEGIQSKNAHVNMVESGDKFVDANTLMVRWSTERVMQKIELLLTNKKTVLQYDDKNQPYETTISIGDPLANSEGVNGILKLVEMRVNEHTVQGNFQSKTGIYEEYIYWTRLEITNAIILNRVVWDVADTKSEMIIDNIMGLIIPFMTRPIDNLERSGLINMQSREVIIHDPKKGGGGLMGFARGIGK